MLVKKADKMMAKIKVCLLSILFINILLFASCADPTNPETSTNPETNYSINIVVANPEWGRVTCYARVPNPGDTITVTVRPNEGYYVKNNTLLVNGGTVPLMVIYQYDTIQQYSFTMPTSDVTITAEFEPIKDHSINILVSNPDWGSVECDVDSEYPGKLVFLTIRTKKDYRLKKNAFKVNNGDIPLQLSFQGGTLASYYFIMPYFDVTITVDFEPYPYFEILNINFPLDGEQFEIQRVNFSGNETTQLTLNNLNNRSVFLAHVNTSDSGIDIEQIENRYISRVEEFNRNPAPLPPLGNRSFQRSLVPFVPCEVGDTRKFWVELYIDGSIDWYEINATVQAVSEHCNNWVAYDNFYDSSTNI